MKVGNLRSNGADPYAFFGANSLEFPSQAVRDGRTFFVTYLVTSVLWLVFTDALVEAFSVGNQMRHELHSVSGVLYVLVVGFALSRLVQKFISEADVSQRDMLESQMELVTRLARATEYRDRGTGEHNERIAAYAGATARELGMDARSCRLISQAALLHDVGKIAIPDAILLKPGPLTPAEREVIESHVLFGAELLDGSSHKLGKLARSVALSHHERWDGRGYPRGLTGTAIPLEGRIVAVCDVYDALVSERPYKAAWTQADAIAEIRRDAGKAFDPQVVEAFERALTHFTETRAGGFKAALSLEPSTSNA